MKWTEPKVNEERVATRFLLTPLCIGGKCRWLERATLREKYTRHYDGQSIWDTWEPIAWEDNEGGMR